MKYTNLIIINDITKKICIKEFIDIALVSISYDIYPALFLSSKTIDIIKSTDDNDSELLSAINMLKEFKVEVFSAKQDIIKQLNISNINLDTLKEKSKNIFEFK